jgi:hypothetical protein
MRMSESRLSCALVLVVAAGLHQQACRAGDTARGQRLLRMAADVLDHTRPDPQVLQAYPYKDPETSDVRFLAQHLALVALVPEPERPPRKVRSRDWAEYTRVLQGLAEALGAPPAAPREAARNRAALAAFVLGHLDVLDAPDQASLRAYLAPFPAPAICAGVPS